MPLLPLKLGNGSNLDVDSTTVSDGALISQINAYQDRGGAFRLWPGHTEYAVVDESISLNRNVWTYYSYLHNVLIIICNGAIYKQTEANGALTAITGATLDASVVPTFTEDADNIFIAANSAVYQLDLATNTAGLLGSVVPVLDLILVATSISTTGRSIALSCSGSTSIYYTVDGTPPDKTKTLYTSAVSITNAQKLQAIAYNADDIESEIVTSDDFSCVFVVEGEHPNPRLVTIVSDKAASIYYTVDGTQPTTASLAYTPGTKIAVNSTLTLKAVSIDGNNSYSEIISADYSVDTTGDSTKPNYKKFEVGAVEKNSVVITTMSATDAKGVTGYCITESATPPLLNDEKWSAEPITKYTSRTSTAGTRDLYPWARDAAGNVSNVETPVSVAFLAADLVPDDFSFTAQIDVERSRYIESDAIIPAGITFDTPFSISGGEYAISVNGGFAWTNWRTTASTIKPGYAIKVRHTSSATGGTAVTTTLTIGGISGTFTSTTKSDQLPRSVTKLSYIGGYIMAIGEPAVGSSVAGDVMFSDDKVNNYAAWEVYNNESNPDAVKALVIAYEQVYNIGERTTEVAIIDGTTPFAANKNASQHFGTMAPDAVVFDKESIYFPTDIQGRKIIKLAGGSAPKIISDSIEPLLEEMTSIADAVGYHMGFKRQNFVVFDFPSANVIIDDQTYDAVTLAYHLQKESWLIVGRYDVTESIFLPYRGTSFTYIEPWGLSLIGGRDGKLYKLYDDTTPDYTDEPILTHRWRDNHESAWQIRREIALGPAGDTTYPPDEYQCGLYRSRQHELVYSDPTKDAGEMFRAVIKTGWTDHGRDVDKVAAYYRYNVKRGANDLVINGISEQVQFLRR